jgi:hypothetical protein
MLNQRTRRVAQILSKLLEPIPGPGRASVLLNEGDTSQVSPRCVLSILKRGAFQPVFLSRFFHMKTEFCLKVLFPASATKEPS